LILGYFFTRIVFFLARGATPKINIFFKRSQIVSAIALSLSHGTNDAQKTMGVILKTVIGLHYQMSEIGVSTS